MLRIEFSNKASNFMRKCEAKLRSRIFKKIDLLKSNPVPSDAKSLKGYKEPTFKIRVGKYRVLYEVNHMIKSFLLLRSINEEEFMINC